MFDELYSNFLFFPEFEVSVDGGCDEEFGSGSTSKREGVSEEATNLAGKVGE